MTNATMQSYPPVNVSAAQMDAATAQQAIEMERLRLQSEQLKMEQMRMAEEKREREERREREDRREREEREAAHQRALHMQYAAMQAQAQSHTVAAAITANTAMSCASHGAGGGVIYREENYCGPLSWIIGCFLFPCICCCPIDRRQVAVAVPALPPPMRTTMLQYPPQPVAMYVPPTPYMDPSAVTVHVNQGTPAVGKPI